MNILYIVSKFGPRVQGFAKYLKLEGYNVYLLDVHRCWFALKDIDMNPPLVSPNVQLKNPPIMFENRILRIATSLYRIIETIMHKIVKEKIDIIISYNPHIATAFPAFIASRLLGVPWILDYADLVAMYDTYNYPYAALEVTLAKKADGLIVLTNSWKSVLQRYWGIPNYKIVRIPNGIDLDIFNEEKMKNLDCEYFKAKLGINEEKIIGYLGSTAYRKTRWGYVDLQNVTSLIKAIPYIIQKNSNIKFLFAGFNLDEKIAHLIKLLNIEEYIKMTGPYRYGSLEHLCYLKISNIFWLSAAKSFSMEFFDRFKIYEYMICGKPIIAPCTISMKEILGISYPFYKIDDPKSIARVAEFFIENPSFCEKIGKDLQFRVKKYYNWKALSKKLIHFLDDIYNNYRWK